MSEIITAPVSNSDFEKARKNRVQSPEASPLMKEFAIRHSQKEDVLTVQERLKATAFGMVKDAVAKEKATYAVRQRAATKSGEEVAYMQDGLGQHLARIPADIYYRLLRDPHMKEIFKDRKLMMKFLNDNPEMKRRKQGNMGTAHRYI